MSDKSRTPETDKEASWSSLQGFSTVPAEFARKMEHERNMARAAANTFRQCAEVTFGPMPFPRKFHWENAQAMASADEKTTPKETTL